MAGWPQCVSNPSPSLPRIIDQRFEKVSYFVFGDFNFRLDSKSVVEVGAQLGPPWPLAGSACREEQPGQLCFTSRPRVVAPGE